MYTGKKNCFHAFMSHGDEVVIPPSGAVITSSNDHSRIQGMAVTRNGTESWFVQYVSGVFKISTVVKIISGPTGTTPSTTSSTTRCSSAPGRSA